MLSHYKATPAAKAVSAGQILHHAGLDFEVSKQPHFIQRVTRDGDVYSESNSSCAIFRTDTGDEIGDVRKTYEPAQTADVLKPFLMAAQEGFMSYSGGEAIDNGRRYSLRFDVGDVTVVHGERLQKQVIVGGSNDGSWSTFIKTCVMREVCTNGLMGLSEMNAHFRIKHTTNWQARYNEVLIKLEQTDKFFVEAMAKYNELFGITLSREVRALLTRDLLDIDVKKEISTRKQNQFERIMTLSERGKGIRGNNEILNTGAAWYNAVAEYVDHETNSGNREKQYVSAFFGAGEKRKKKAYELLTTV